MNKSILFTLICCVSFSGESSQSLLVNINSQRIIRSYQNINSKIKLMSIDQKWVWNVF